MSLVTVARLKFLLSCDEDTAGYVIGLYSDGHKEVLHALFAVGIRSDAALSELLASFYGDVLSSSPQEFIDTVRSFSSADQRQLCEMTGAGDGGGVSVDVLNHPPGSIQDYE